MKKKLLGLLCIVSLVFNGTPPLMANDVLDEEKNRSSDQTFSVGTGKTENRTPLVNHLPASGTTTSLSTATATAASQMQDTILGLKASGMTEVQIKQLLSQTYTSGEVEAGLAKTNNLLAQEGTVTTNEQGSVTGIRNYDSTGNVTSATHVGESGVVIGWTTYDAYGRPEASYNAWGSKVETFEYNSHGFLNRVINYGQNGAITGWTTMDAYGRAGTAYNEKGCKISQYVYSDRGFLVKTLNYGDNETFIGETLFNVYGKPTASYNEFGQLTARFHYSSSGFLTEVSSYGKDGTYMGKTTYDVYGRQDKSYNAQGALISSNTYSAQGFILSSTSYGNNGAITGTTHYNDLGKPTSVTNAEGYTVQRFEYNDHGFLSRSVNLSYDGAKYVTTGYTTYDAAGRQMSSYAVYDDGTHGEKSYKVADYNYSNGFLSSATNFTLKLDANGNSTGELINAGSTTYDKYGRPSESFNEKGALVNRNTYNGQGFITETLQYGEDQTYLGKITYNDQGRPDAGYNQTGALTTRYFYNSYGNLACTISYSHDTPLARVEYNAYGKATNTYLLFKAGAVSASTNTDYAKLAALWKAEMSSNPALQNLDPENLTTAAWQALNENNLDTVIAATLTVLDKYMAGAQAGDQGLINHVGTALFILGQALKQAGKNEEAASAFKLQIANFDTTQCFDPATNSWWSVKTASTEQLQAMGVNTSDLSSANLSNIGGYQYSESGTPNYSDGGKSGGALTSRSEYNEYGILVKTVAFGRDGTQSGYTTIDSFGRAIASYNSAGSKVMDYHYNANGFLASTVSYYTDSESNTNSTSRTYYNKLGQQTETYQLKADGTDGAKIAAYRYDTAGFLSEAQSFVDGTYSGKTVYDITGREVATYNSQGALTGKFLYDQNGFITASVNIAPQS
ncbi:MAG: hypothetical protein NC924_00885 [Candidatus Omnitrophica bacterium]|nr:hypothetical protein [Candidatus Omnitrophota bacterium]